MFGSLLSLAVQLAAIPVQQLGGGDECGETVWQMLHGVTKNFSEVSEQLRVEEKCEAATIIDACNPCYH